MYKRRRRLPKSPHSKCAKEEEDYNFSMTKPLKCVALTHLLLSSHTSFIQPNNKPIKSLEFHKKGKKIAEQYELT